METSRQRLLKRHAQLLSERTTWDAHWKDIASQMQPRRARWDKGELNSGSKRNDKIVNNRPLIAIRVLAAGMMSGATSPARPWFRLLTTDPDLDEYSPVRTWLHLVEERMRERFGKSNLYNGIAGGTYPDLGGFGTHCGFLEEDLKDVIRYYPLPLGEYCFAVSARGIIDTVIRDVPFTVRQTVQRFGLKAVSTRVKNDWEKGNYERVVDLVHYVCPNDEYDPTANRTGYSGKEWASLWMEKACEGEEEKAGYLAQGGYHEFPALCPRWSVTSFNDAYGCSPGMDALGDAKELQHLETRKAALVDKLTNPPMVAPESLRNQRASLLPGDVTYVPDRAGATMKFEPAYEPPAQALSSVVDLINDCGGRVDRAFYADLWLQMLQDARLQPRTATEVDQRQQEQMLQLGPVVNRLEAEFLNPLIDRTFAIMLRRGEIPRPPQEMKGKTVRVEYLSVMAQAQRLVGVGAIERFTNFVAQLSAVKEDAMDNLNTDEVVNEMARVLGVKPDLVLSREKVAVLRTERARQLQAQQQGEAMAEAAKGAKNLGNTPAPSSDNALGALLQGISPAATPGYPMAAPGQA